MARRPLTLLAPGTSLFRKIVSLNFGENSLLPVEQGIAGFRGHNVLKSDEMFFVLRLQCSH